MNKIERSRYPRRTHRQDGGADEGGRRASGCRRSRSGQTSQQAKTRPKRSPLGVAELRAQRQKKKTGQHRRPSQVDHGVASGIKASAGQARDAVANRLGPKAVGRASRQRRTSDTTCRAGSAGSQADGPRSSAPSSASIIRLAHLAAKDWGSVITGGNTTGSSRL